MLAASLLLLFARWLWPFVVGSESDPVSLRGVRLGMTAEQVRARFDEGRPATFRTEIAGEDLVLVRSPTSTVDREARFEIHEGMLVAVRLDLPEDAPEVAEAPRTTALSVFARLPADPGRARLVLLSRQCPTHAEEVARLLAGAAP